MNTIDFCFWLQGYFEISASKNLDSAQIDVIKNHLNLVFVHEIDPLREKETSTPKASLNDAHSPKNDTLYRC